MQINIILTTEEKSSLDALINLMVSFGLEHALFVTNDKVFLDKHRRNIGEFYYNEILEHYPEGCGSIKFRFTKLGFGLIKVYQPEIFKELKPILDHRIPAIPTHSLPNVSIKIIKEKTTT